MAERGRALKGLMRKGGAFGQKALSFPFSFPKSREGAPGASAAALAGDPRHGGGSGPGEKGEGPLGDPIPLPICAEVTHGEVPTVAHGGGRRRPKGWCCGHGKGARGGG